MAVYQDPNEIRIVIIKFYDSLPKLIMVFGLMVFPHFGLRIADCGFKVFCRFY